jgi:XTP/dITP diphosphohydrolase
MKLCFATNNLHKLEEVKHAVGNRLEIVSLQQINCNEELPETRDTLEGNSLQKAEYVYQHFNVPCFADDTGLEVESLHGAPGVYSARYAGDHKNNEDNINLLLHNLNNKDNRKARFRTIVTLIGLGQVQIFEGIINGKIISERKGNKGFGYDPVFVPEGYTQTLAEMSLEEKNKISHRAIAVQKLIAFLKSI